MATGAPSAQRQAVPVRHRPNVEEMSPAQLAELRKAFAAMKEISDDRGYNYYGGLHGLPLPPECEIAHGQPSFLPWHRAYLLRFEQALRDTGYDVMLPWWDWLKTPDIPKAFGDETQPDGSPNPLFSAPIDPLALEQGKKSNERETRELAEIPDTVRQPERPGTWLPSEEDIAVVSGYETYEQFCSNLDDLHGAVHVWAGGHMGNLPFAAFDPIFWAHHCMIDRLWGIWQAEHSDFPSKVLNKTMKPFNLTAGEVLETTALGYDYSASIAQVRPPS